MDFGGVVGGSRLEGQVPGGGGGGLAHIPSGHFVYVSICLSRGNSKMTPKVHI